jgi:hypothetical protein
VRRVLLVLAVAALMAAMMAIAGPANAVTVHNNNDNDNGNHSSVTFVSVNSHFHKFRGHGGSRFHNGHDVKIKGNGSFTIR